MFRNSFEFGLFRLIELGIYEVNRTSTDKPRESGARNARTPSRSAHKSGDSLIKASFLGFPLWTEDREYNSVPYYALRNCSIRQGQML